LFKKTLQTTPTSETQLKLTTTPARSKVFVPSSSNNSSPYASDDEETPSHFHLAKKRKLTVETPEFVMYTDPELKAFERKKEDITISSSLQQRLCQCTISNMISATQSLSEPRYPNFGEIRNVSKHLCELYPALLVNGKWVRFCLFLVHM